jgi:hypothetical protein
LLLQEWVLPLGLSLQCLSRGVGALGDTGQRIYARLALAEAGSADLPELLLCAAYAAEELLPLPLQATSKAEQITDLALLLAL